MKKLKYLVFGVLLSTSISAHAQVSVNINLGQPPVWAPATAEKVQYYYLPEIETYYDVPAQRYIYVKNGKWYRSAALPAHYRTYNLKKGKIVYLTDYKGQKPYYFHKSHKIKYGKFKSVNPKNQKGFSNKEQKNNHHGKNHGKSKGNKK
jgi:hypothetical protein